MNLLSAKTTKTAEAKSNRLLSYLCENNKNQVVCKGNYLVLVWTPKGHFILANNASQGSKTYQNTIFIKKPNSRKIFGGIDTENKTLQQIANEILIRIGVA